MIEVAPTLLDNLQVGLLFQQLHKQALLVPLPHSASPRRTHPLLGSPRRTHPHSASLKQTHPHSASPRQTHPHSASPNQTHSLQLLASFRPKPQLLILALVPHLQLSIHHSVHHQALLVKLLPLKHLVLLPQFLVELLLLRARLLVLIITLATLNHLGYINHLQVWGKQHHLLGSQLQDSNRTPLVLILIFLAHPQLDSVEICSAIRHLH